MSNISYSNEKYSDNVKRFVDVRENAIVVGEMSDSPHGVNSASSCAVKEFIVGETEQSKMCRHNIVQLFGQEELDKILAIVKKGSI